MNKILEKMDKFLEVQEKNPTSQRKRTKLFKTWKWKNHQLNDFWKWKIKVSEPELQKKALQK